MFKISLLNIKQCKSWNAFTTSIEPIKQSKTVNFCIEFNKFSKIFVCHK